MSGNKKDSLFATVPAKHQIWQQVYKDNMVGRPRLDLSPEERRTRRNIQIAVCKAKRRAKDLYLVKQKSSFQRWNYRRKHPEAVAKEKERIATRKVKLRKQQLKERRRLERSASHKFIAKLFKDWKIHGQNELKNFLSRLCKSHSCYSILYNDSSDKHCQSPSLSI